MVGISVCMSVYECVGTLMPQCACGSQKSVIQAELFGAVFTVE